MCFAVDAKTELCTGGISFAHPGRLYASSAYQIFTDNMIVAILVILSILVPTSLGGSNGGGSLNSNSNSNGNGGGPNLGGIGADSAQLTSRVVHTKYGAVSGVIVHLEGRHLDPVEAFKGIPYASPPIGSLRFMPPVTGALWSGVKKADR